MKSEPIGYYESAGGTMLAEGTVSWSLNGASTVTVTVSLNYCYAQGWRIKRQGAVGNDGVVAEGSSGQLTSSFSATNGQTYVFQVNHAGNMENDGNGVFTVDTSTDSGGDDSGGGSSSGGGEGSTTNNYVSLYVESGYGCSVSVKIIDADNNVTEPYFSHASGGYTFYLYFSYYRSNRLQIEVNSLEGYELDQYNGRNYKVEGATYNSSDGTWSSDYQVGAVKIIATATANVEYQEPSSYYLYAVADDAVKEINISRTYTTDSATAEGSYLGELINGKYAYCNGYYCVRYPIWREDRFIVQPEFLEGYTLHSLEIGGHVEETENSDEFYLLSYGDYAEIIVYSMEDNGEDSGGNNGDDSGGDVSGGGSGSTTIGSGSGTLYFNATNYGQQYAVEYSYNSSTFTIKSVKVKLAQYASVWWAFNLTAKINDTIIYSGTENHFIDTFDWYDLGISGSASVANTVTVSLSGSAIHDNYQFNVASPTSQTINTGNSGSGSGGGDSGGNSGGNSSSGSDTATASGVTAKATWTAGSNKVTVTITSLGGYNAGLYWRLKGVKSEGDENTYIPQTNSTSATFTQNVSKKNYTFQICPNGTWTNDGGDTSKLTVDFGSDFSGGDSDSDTVEPCGQLIVNQGEGTILHVQRSWPPERTCYTDLQTGEPIYCDGEDCFFFEVEVLDGYELDYYDFEDKQLGYILENFDSYTSDSDTDFYRISSYGDAIITSTAKPIATAHIYNNFNWDKYGLYIYDNFDWNRYTPYIYNGSSWDRYN